MKLKKYVKYQIESEVNKMNKIIYAMALSLVICLSMTVYSKETTEDLKENIVRLHIIANSDSEEDQAVKLMVRDEILKEGIGSDYKEIADTTLRENGFTYTASCEEGYFYFHKKEYKNTVFPRGEYRAVRVVLGNGEGKNWWCVLNPPLCFSENPEGEMQDKSMRELKDSLDRETYEIITKKPVIKFKVVEIVNGIANRITR